MTQLENPENQENIEPTQNEELKQNIDLSSHNESPQNVPGLNIKGTVNNLSNFKSINKIAKFGKMTKNVSGIIQATQKIRAGIVAIEIAVATSEVWVPILIIIIIVIGFFTLLYAFLGELPDWLTLTSSGPTTAKIGDKLDYAITINYPGTAKNIIITDKIPEGTKFIDAPQGIYDYKTNTVTWNLSNISSSASATTFNKTLSLTLLVTKDNDYIVNTPKGVILGGVLGESDSQVFNKSITPTIFQTTFNETLKKNNSPLPALDITPTIFQVSAPSSELPSANTIISNCVITKIGEPAVIPSLPPECQ